MQILTGIKVLTDGSGGADGIDKQRRAVPRPELGQLHISEEQRSVDERVDEGIVPAEERRDEVGYNAITSDGCPGAGRHFEWTLCQGFGIDIGDVFLRHARAGCRRERQEGFGILKVLEDPEGVVTAPEASVDFVGFILWLAAQVAEEVFELVVLALQLLVRFLEVGVARNSAFSDGVVALVVSPPGTSTTNGAGSVALRGLARAMAGRWGSCGSPSTFVFFF